MSVREEGLTARSRLSPGLADWFMRLVAKPKFQSVASRLPFGKAMAKRDGAQIFDILQGFVASQVLTALIELGLLRRLLEGADTVENMALSCGVAHDRMAELLRAGVALGFLKKRGKSHYGLARRGAAILGVPGLELMIRHNRHFYADMADPVKLLRGEDETQLQRFWPYVFGASADVASDDASRYSELMAQSQVLVAEDTLRAISLKGARAVMDVGGGSGVFLSHVLRAYPQAHGIWMDLPEVLPSATTYMHQEALSDRVQLHPGSFRTDALPTGADVITLIRVLYDHSDATVAQLLSKVFDALPSGGRLVISEPMAGGRHPDPAGDVYFTFYTMAMGTGKTRSPERIAELCRAAGFADVRTPGSARPYITSVLTARKSSTAV
ncbi:MAG: methyltransferase [Roseovarius sp.]